MLKFIYYPKSRKIVYLKSKKRVTFRHVYEMSKQNNQIEIVEAYTLKNITDEMMNRFVRWGANPPSDELNTDVYGPATPLNETKIYRCNQCDTPTPNRFKCQNCWDQVTDNYEDELLYML